MPWNSKQGMNCGASAQEARAEQEGESGLTAKPSNANAPAIWFDQVSLRTRAEEPSSTTSNSRSRAAPRRRCLAAADRERPRSCAWSTAWLSPPPGRWWSREGRPPMGPDCLAEIHRLRDPGDRALSPLERGAQYGRRAGDLRKLQKRLPGGCSSCLRWLALTMPLLPGGCPMNSQEDSGSVSAWREPSRRSPSCF